MPHNITAALREALSGTSLDPSAQKAAENAVEGGQTNTDPPPAKNAVIDDATVEDGFVVEGGGTEGADAGDGAEGADAGDGAEGGDDGIEYINDLPDALGWSPEDLYGLKLKLSGDQDPVPLGEIKDRLQSADKDKAQIENDRKALEEERNKLNQAIAQRQTVSTAIDNDITQARGQMAALEQAYPELEKNWATREKTEPGQVALERQQIATQYAGAKGKLQTAAAANQQMQAGARVEWMANQNKILTNKIPEWKDDNKRKQFQQEILDFAEKEYGATKTDLRNIDAKTVLMLRDAMHGAAVREKTKDAVTKPKRMPKVVPKGAKVRNPVVKKARSDELINQARRTKSRGDITAAIKGVLSTASK